MNRIKNNKKGFTLIEVVLVLAIGGLIFLLAFIAFQQVSTNRRDTQRRSDASRVVSEMENFKGDTGSYPGLVTPTGGLANSGAILPASANTFFVNYMGGAEFKDPNGNVYTVSLSNTTPAKATSTTSFVTIHPGSTCAAGGGLTAASAGSVAVQIGLEKGVICRDNS